MILVVIVLGVLVIAMGLLLFRSGNKKSDTSALLIKQDINQLNNAMLQLKEGLSDKLTERLDRNQSMMLGSMQRQYGESTKLITEITKNLTELKESNKQVLGITDELKTLQNVLINPKQRGVLGEYYLATVLKNVLAPDQFSLQYKFKDGDIVDAVIFLDNKRILSIDSKFTLENYNRLTEEKDPAKRVVLAKLFREDLKKRIDETSKYIRPEERTLDYAFMFIPSEAIYYDLLANKVGATNMASRDLIEYAFRDKKVIIVSPTTFMAYLQTVLQGLRTLQIEETAKEIQQRVGELGRHIGVYEQYMEKLGSSLGTTVNHYNAAHKELKKVDKDIIKIAHTSPVVEPMLLDKPSMDEE
jgi:DNA recombination protein RmuC